MRFKSAKAACFPVALASAFVSSQAFAQAADPSAAAQPVESPGPEPAIDESVATLTNWVIASRDNNHVPFIVIDKVAAKVFVFDADSRLVGETPALLGIARGDDSAPGVGNKKLSAIAHDDRTTPAGRFVARIGKASGNHEVLWVDYATSISLHPVVTANRKEHRLQRLNSPSPEDNRITFGCINVSAAFYKDVVRPLFSKTTGIVYILPETRALTEVFPAFTQRPS